MRDLPLGLGGLSKDAFSSPEFVVQLSWDEADTDYTYLSSTNDVVLPGRVSVIDSVVDGISGQTQKINPSIATSTIGVVSIRLIDLLYENLFLQSSNPNTSPWVNSNVTATEDITEAPDGTTTGGILSDVSAVLGGTNSQSVTIKDSSSALCFARYFKQGTATESYFTVSLTGGTTVNGSTIIDWTTSPPSLLSSPTSSGTIESVANGWYLVKQFVTNNGTGNTTATAYTFPAGPAAADTGTVYVWGMHGSYGRDAPIYLPTTVDTVSEGVLTGKINEKLVAGNGLRGKIVRVYVGYQNIPWDQYSLRLTYIIDDVKYFDGVYGLVCSDLQRSVRSKVFTPHVTNLSASIDASTLIIPVISSDTSKFPLVLRGSETFNFPGQTISFIKIEDEVVATASTVQFDTTSGWYIAAIQRGALGTRAVEHTVDIGTADSRKPIVTEHIYLEGAGPKIIYALSTGLLLHGDNVLPLPFDFSQWTLVSTPVIEVTSDATPTGWGSAYSITDDNAGAFEAIALDSTISEYTHGDTWSVSIFVRKQAASTEALLRVVFRNGAATSIGDLILDPSSGVTSTSSTNVTIVSSEVVDFDSDWYFARISAFTTTTGTTQAGIEFYPAVSGATDVGTATIFGGFLGKGDKKGWPALPRHWHLGIHEKFVRLSDFKSLGDDYWNVSDDSGRWCRIENPDTQDGKRYIEKEILVWLGAFIPIYSTGELGIRRLRRILSDSGYQILLTEENVVSYTQLQHRMRDVINDIRVNWNWLDSREEFTKLSVFVDADSIAIHGNADEKVFKFKTVHTGVHTDENLLAYFDTLRDRYSGPPLLLSVQVMPSLNRLEVGDTVRVQVDQIRDYTSNSGIDRTFEVQQVTTNWMTGGLKLSLFASSQSAGALDRTTLPNVMEDAWYISEGTNMTSVLTIVAGAVTISGTLTGTANMTDSGSIFYYDGNLTINNGITVTIEDNVQLRIKGNLTVNGQINGVAQGPAGGAATSTFVGGGTSDTYNVGLFTWDPIAPPQFNLGSDGYFGVPVAGGSFFFNSSANPPTAANNSRVGFSNGWGQTWQIDTPLAGASKGDITALPHFDIRNPNGRSLEGLPTDLRGHGGPSGMVVNNRVSTGFSGTYYINAASGGGGAGGAGLLTVCRGMTFVGAGNIDLSGGPSTVPATLVASGKTFHGGHGAPGAPGAFLLLIDGQYTNPDISEFVFTAAYGSTTATGTPTEIGIQGDGNTQVPTGANISNWPFTNSIYNLGVLKATQDEDLFDSAYKLQYLPPAENPRYGLSVDFGGPLTERGKYNDLLFWQYGSFTTNEQYGSAVAVTNDGSRFAVGTQGELAAGANDSVRITRSVKNPIDEQLIARPGVSNVAFGQTDVEFDTGGDRLMVNDISYLTNTGVVYVYSRSGQVWTLEQTILAGGGAGSTNFGAFPSWDATATHLIINNRILNNKIEYWSRSAAVWTYQETLPEPTAKSSLFPTGLQISKDGLWLVASDYNAPSPSPGDGRVYLYKRTTNSPQWELVDDDGWGVPGATDNPDNTVNWNLGFGDTTTFEYRGVIPNYDATVVVAHGAKDVADGGGIWLHSFERQGEQLVYVGRAEMTAVPADGPQQTPRLVGVSSNGLTALTSDFASLPSGTGTLAHYRRNSISEGFKFDHSVKSHDVLGYTPRASRVSDSGQFIIVGNIDSDFGFTNSGHIEIWEYYPEAD